MTTTKGDWIGIAVFVCAFVFLIGVAFTTPIQETEMALDQTIPQLLHEMDIPLYNVELTNHMQAFAARAIASPEGSFFDNNEFAQFIIDNPLTTQVFYYDISENSEGFLPEQKLTRVYWIMGSAGIPYVTETYKPTAPTTPYLDRSWEVADTTLETVIFAETRCGSSYIIGCFFLSAIICFFAAWVFDIASGTKRIGCSR